MTDEKDERPAQVLKVVSENVHLPSKEQRDAKLAEERARDEEKWARELANQALAELAATILRTMAGSESASIQIMRCINNFIDAHNALRTKIGRGMTLADERKVLILPTPEWPSGKEDYQTKRWLMDDAFHTILNGALRLAAHKVLEERPHFGGKYSTRVIEDGIRQLEQAREWRPRPPIAPVLPRSPSKASPRQAKSSQRAMKTKAVAQQPRILKDPSGGKRKRWSPMDSKSWRDAEKDELEGKDI